MNYDIKGPTASRSYYTDWVSLSISTEIENEMEMKMVADS